MQLQRRTTVFVSYSHKNKRWLDYPRTAGFSASSHH